MTQKNDVVIYQGKDGSIELRGDFDIETIWATQTQMVDLFGVDQSVVSRHIKNIFRDNEVNQISNMQKMHIANSDKPVTFYSLDIILAVGYRANSKIAISFRQWATKTLKKHITEGYTINPSQIEKNHKSFLKAIEEIKQLIPNASVIGTTEALDLVKFFASTWFSLDAYDRASLPSVGLDKKQVDLTVETLTAALIKLKKNLLTKGEATELFAQEKQSGNLAGIVGNVMQSVFGEDAYLTVEEKAAHLLYFIIKNHPFNDGNKRSGAFAFVWFLERAGTLDVKRLTPEALTALTILIAESNPRDKERMIGLVILFLNTSSNTLE